MLYILMITSLFTIFSISATTPPDIGQAINMIHRVSDITKLADAIKQSPQTHHWRTQIEKRLAHEKTQGTYLNHFIGALAQKTIFNLEQLLALLK